jgi:hypothetical protein
VDEDQECDAEYVSLSYPPLLHVLVEEMGADGTRKDEECSGEGCGCMSTRRTMRRSLGEVVEIR